MPTLASSAESLKSFAPECPRCGYDQAGEVATWHESCPLSGQCPECGLEFRWTDLHSGRYAYPKWSYEHARHGVLSFGAFAKTMARCLTPWRLWRGLKMHHAVVRTRLAIFAVAGVVLSWSFIFGLSVGTMALLSYVAYGPWSVRNNIQRLLDNPLYMWPERYPTFHVLIDPTFDRWMVLTFWVLLTAPLVLFSLRHSVRLANIRPGNLARVWVYGLVLLPVVLGAWCNIRMLLAAACDVLSGMGGTGVVGAVRSVLEPLSFWVYRRYDWDMLLVVASAYTFLWLWLAYRRYLQLPHAFGVALASVLLSIFVGLGLIAIFLPGGLLIMM